MKSLWKTEEAIAKLPKESPQPLRRHVPALSPLQDQAESEDPRGKPRAFAEWRREHQSRGLLMAPPKKYRHG